MTDLTFRCPRCNCEWTHVDDVYMMGRTTEDGELVPVHVDHAGRIGTGPFPMGQNGLGRRHEITLAGYCENGCKFRLLFKQHKGETLIETTVATKTPTGHEYWVSADKGKIDPIDDDEL